MLVNPRSNVKEKTLVVLGAGASKEVGLPIGRELTSTIARLLNIEFDDFNKQISGDRTIMDAIRLLVKQSAGSIDDINPYLHAAWRIRDAMPQAASIDSFIDAHNDDRKIELCGKLAVVRSILSAERDSRLYFDKSVGESGIKYHLVRDTWFGSFIELVTDNCRKEDLAARFSNLVMVIFNYDRCIEHFLMHSLQNYYGIDNAQAAELVNGIEIYHPYGKVGHLPWQQHKGSIGFGVEPSPKTLLGVSEQIRTFTEGTNPQSSEIVAIRDQIQECSILLFLGFAFHKLNMELLRQIENTDSVTNRSTCYATAHGISVFDCQIIERDVARRKLANFDKIYIRYDLTCSALFNEYRRSLSFA